MNNKITKQSFIDKTRGQRNEIREFEGILIGIVCWHNNMWKIVNDNNFDKIADWEYKPVKEFRLREDLWSYIKNELL